MESTTFEQERISYICNEEKLQETAGQKSKKPRVLQLEYRYVDFSGVGCVTACVKDIHCIVLLPRFKPLLVVLGETRLAEKGISEMRTGNGGSGTEDSVT